jgi:hypothetical protein
MAEVVHGTPQEFWRPPSPVSANDETTPASTLTMAPACNRCGSEFLLGAGFCHSCGMRRPPAVSAAAQADATIIANVWEQAVDGFQALVGNCQKLRFPSWLRYLHFHEIKHRIGLSTAAFVSFLIGLGCIAGALLVGLLTAKTYVDWQAIQLYRAEWLLAATAAFVAGILLKKPSSKHGGD